VYRSSSIGSCWIRSARQLSLALASPALVHPSVARSMAGDLSPAASPVLSRGLAFD
jgi:hypothetical protein